jgi:hypothetical protein
MEALMTRSLSIGFVVIALTAATACGKSAEEQQAEEAAKAVQTGADAMAQGAATVAKGLEQMAQSAGGKVEVLPFETLGTALPDVSGWERGKVTGSSTAFPMAMSQTEATYTNGNAEIEVEIIDTALNQMLFAPFSMYLAANYSERTSDGYRKGTTIKGEPGFEEVNTPDKTAEITLVVGKRFIVHARGRDVAGIEPVRAALERMDFSKLTAAK